LNPRPKEEFIYKAYATYYTHGGTVRSFKDKLKEKIRNECHSHWLSTSIEPRFNVPKILGFILKPLNKILHIPYELNELVKTPKGRLLDVGCGSGGTLLLAKQLGWEVVGLEIDPEAVRAAKNNGLNVIQGDYRNLKNYSEEFDAVICSHVLEHVHQPVELLELLLDSLKKRGLLFLSTPNSESHMKVRFGKFWRGIEAPRHLHLLGADNLITYFTKKNVLDIKQYPVFNSTLLSSSKIAQRKDLNFTKNIALYIQKMFSQFNNVSQSDFVNLIIEK
jgi:2-polyprenyl-3-methyl-5-hydroxy-6-metoxy-1,4-benzoquinol methylase